MKSTPETNELLIALNYENNKILMSMRETLFSIQSMLKYFYVMSIIGLILLVIFILIYVFRLFGN